MVIVWSSGPTPRRLVHLALALLLLPALAGCVDEPTSDPLDGNPDPSPGSDPGPADADVSPPTWAVGDHWTFRPSEGDPATLVVVEDAGGDWIIGTDSKDVSFFHAQEEISNLGPQRKSDLAGSQGSDRIQYFQWPLTDGAQWTTRWDGVDRQITATDDGDGTWSFEATEGDTVTVRYGYDPKTRWFDALEFLTPDGDIAFGWTVQQAGRNWTGETYRWHLDPVITFDETDVLAYSIQPTQFTVPPEATDVWARFHTGCTQGVLASGVHPVPWDAGGIGQRWHTACTGPESFEGSLGHAAGDWNADFAWHDTTAGDVSGTVYVRTMETIPIG